MTADGEPVAELGGALVVDLGAGDDGEDVGLRHGVQIHAHQRGEAGAAGFDHPQVGEVVDDATAVGVEKHDFFAGFEGRDRVGHAAILAEFGEICNVRVGGVK